MSGAGGKQPVALPTAGHHFPLRWDKDERAGKQNGIMSLLGFCSAAGSVTHQRHSPSHSRANDWLHAGKPVPLLLADVSSGSHRLLC